ncbi:60Kd inner membrane protein-domain-containing protein [Mycena floridula]|nr:60Kd inner membrane protein-domain-containing protein [Mycena floridula]
MLRRCVRPPPSLRTVHRYGQRRHFIQDLSNGFLDLAIVLPFPASFPPYSSTIILLTVLIRTSLLPLAIWRQRRVDRAEQIVLPEVRRIKTTLGKPVFEQMQKDGIVGDKQYLMKVHFQRCTAILKARRKELYAQHNCKPMPTMVVPFLAQAPPFILLSLVLSRASTDPTPFDSESFMTLTTLAHPDPTMVIPILVGLITAANMETSILLRARTSTGSTPAKNPDRSKFVQNLVKQFMSGLAVIRIPLTMLQPGSVGLYWLVSASFGLLETWFVRWLSDRALAKDSTTLPVSDSPPKLIAQAVVKKKGSGKVRK